MFSKEVKMFSEQMKRILIELTFKEFNIQTADIQNVSIDNNVITYNVLDEENTRAVLIFDFNNNLFMLQLDDGYSEIRTLIVLDDNF